MSDKIVGNCLEAKAKKGNIFSTNLFFFYAIIQMLLDTNFLNGLFSVSTSTTLTVKRLEFELDAGVELEVDVEEELSMISPRRNSPFCPIKKKDWL